MGATELPKCLKQASNMTGFALWVDAPSSFWKVELAGKD